MYGDQEKFYRQLYGRKNTSRAIVKSTAATLSGEENNLYSELSNKGTNGNFDLTTSSLGRRDLPHYKVLHQQGAYQELYNLGITVPFLDDHDFNNKSLPSSKEKKNRRSAPELPIPTISSSVPNDNDYYRFNDGLPVGGIPTPGKSKFSDLCNDMSVLAITPEAIREQDTLFRQKAGGKKRARNGERISSTFTTTTTLTVERQILSPNQ